jgi:hypothetical protein
MKRVLKLVAIASSLMLFAVAICGCASIMKGSKGNIAISSTPSDARILIKTTGGVSVYEGKTPATVKVSKKNDYVVTVILDGYQEGTAHITRDGIEGWFWGNLLCGGIIGIIVDLTNGAINKLEPDQIHIEMVRAQGPGGDESIYAVVFATDSNGDLRHLAIPLLPEVGVAQQK